VSPDRHDCTAPYPLAVRGILDIPDALTPVQQAVAAALIRVESVFERELDSDLPAVNRLCRHVERYRGKMLRPTLVLLCGMAAHEGSGSESSAEPTAPGSLLNERHITVAAVCEMVHMATLVHDDVLDEAGTRRRGETVNRLHGNEAAVILGDYLIASAYRLCSTVDTDTALAIGRASQVMCSGELLQLHHRGDFSLDEPTYFEIVERKTAALIAASCQLGARHSGAAPATCLAFETFGRRVGTAFQIQDDLLDLAGDESVVGKPMGQDARKGKLTLPVIHHLGAAEALARGRTLRVLERAAAGEPVSEELGEALRETGSVEYATGVARGLIAEALVAISPIRACGARALLEMMAGAVVGRAF